MHIYVKVSPRSSKNEIYPVKSSLLRGAEQFNGVKKFPQYGEYKIKLTAAPVDNQANIMLIKVLAEYFNLPKSNLKIIGGKSAKIKIIEIQ